MANVSVEINADLARVLKTGLGAEILTLAAAEETATIMEKNISSRYGSGRFYNRRGKDHRASAPGNYPVVDSGALKAAINVIRGRAVDNVDLIINSNYALDLEYGNSRMQSRPFIIKSADEAMRTKFQEIMAKFIEYFNNNPKSLKTALLVDYQRRVFKRASQKAKENWRKRRGL
jgi:hypothetical protein